MEVTVEEGRLVETPTEGATGMDRRAFGEFVSHRGEMASYAIGWRTDADPHAGRLTVGIGVGNPGGATFHAAIFPSERGHGYALIDEAFEDVPQGGPHLTADEARAHDTIEFIWWVVDVVMVRDRRARWLLHWLRGTPSISTPEVFNRDEPILLVVNDDSDPAMWQLIGATNPGEDAKIGHLSHAIDEDPTLLDVVDLEPGEEAERSEHGGPWTRTRHTPEDL